MARRPALSLHEWAVLGVLVERARHGYDIAAELSAGTVVGDTWRVTRQRAYRALERLDALGLVEPRRTEPSHGGPPRTVYGATRRGRAALRAWLTAPVEHLRDMRSEFLLKLVLAERLGAGRRELVRAQRAKFAAVLDAPDPPAGTTDAVGLWRHHARLATAAFLDALDDTAGHGPNGGRRA